METIVLFVIGIVIIIFNARAVLREKNSFKNQLDLKQESSEKFEIEIGKLRNEFGETIFELQKEIENLKENSVKLNKHGDKDEKETGNSEFENYNNVKIDEIKRMIDDKVSMDEISEKTGIGKGELLLIKELYIK
ncbi:MAG: hypothetical protein LKE46_07995 [Clostridium sp.]|jgi:methyl-accepting chemotaxis protein|uniref:hypothetical protein n=1 Tax=Clostridium sp. TaxID=1506 RepID=UPI0025C6B844|nr:hypothetical protein [Clostridium sp.]MCH3964206.1 hypothetical protein [Clostridium sp.]MCI1715387.1 hypothetical protein [Clostridium sp.]MCI1799822.1 hypothetical protein [Clostridium sp.]MCI1813570.1 hypothetical protein [Clostridium sp.]MCI1870640.1 hypothetical protein [Clostridium sp.]